MSVTIRITNLDALIRAVSRYPEIGERRLQRAIVDSLGVVDRLRVRGNGIVPVRTGNLSNSFAFPGAVQVGRLRGTIEPTAKYAIFVDQGTKFMKPRRFMEKLAEKASPEIARKFEDAVTGITQELAGHS